MFTIRAEEHDGSRTVYQCTHYTVAPLTNTGADPEGNRTTVALEGVPNVSEALVIYLGREHPYRTVYVMNEAGRTVDTIGPVCRADYPVGVAA